MATRVLLRALEAAAQCQLAARYKLKSWDITVEQLPKEIIGYVFASVDETKNAMVRGVAKEVRDFLEATDMAGEFYKALTSLSFEVKTEIRFIPNDAGGVRPQVRARAVQKRKRRKGVVETEQIIPPDDASET